VADSFRRARAQTFARVHVLIRLERAQPPAGAVWLLREGEGRVSVSDDVLRFVGWLGLLRALAEVMKTTENSTHG
jgi:hypothetical protein